MEGHRSRPQKGDCIGHVKQLRGDVQQVDVGEHVETVAHEHEAHGADAEPERRDVLPVCVEHDPKRHHHQEDGHRGVGGEHDLDQVGRLLL